MKAFKIPPRLTVLNVLALTLPLFLPVAAMAGQVPNPVVTASARPYNASYTAANLFAAGRNDYATAGQGACSAPLTTTVTDGTWVELDFGTVVEFDRFCLATRVNNVDVVGTNRLYVGNNPVHSADDTVFTWSSAGQNGSGPMRDLGGLVSGRYVRWEVLSTPGSGRNTGGRKMWFLARPTGMIALPSPTVIAATPAYSANYPAPRLVDGKCGTDAGEEYAIAGASSPSPFFVDLDFGAPIRISGYEFLSRDLDVFPTNSLVFSDDPTFATATATNLSNNNSTNGNLWTSATFPAVSARYVRFMGSGFNPGVNAGGRELIFYTPAQQPPQIMRQPQAGTRNLLDLVTLSVLAAGDPPLSYEWRQDGSTLAGATNASIVINPLEVTNAGTYTVVIANNYGSITSAPAILAVTNPAVDLTAGLVAYYAFDETNGLMAADSSGNGYAASLYNFPYDDSMWIPGRIGGGLVFNAHESATNQYVLTDLALSFTDTNLFSFAFWAKRLSDNNPYNPRFITPVGAQHWVLWSPNIGVGFHPPASSPEPIREVWTHFVVTYDRPIGRYEVYVNGTKRLATQDPAYIRTAPDVAVQQWVMGHNEQLNRDLDPWRGFLDEVRVYNRILYPTEARTLYDIAGQLPPSFSRQPQGTTLYAGEPLRLSAIVDGTPPIAVQWRKNGVEIAGATNATLLIPNAQPVDGGDYLLTASNIVRTVVSATAAVQVRTVTSVTNGLAGYWKFDETSGATALDSSGLGHHGIIRNDTADGGQWGPGKVGGSLQFRGPAVLGGAADHVVLPSWAKALNGTMTLSAWVWADTVTEAARIAAGGSGADGLGQFLLGLNAGTGDLLGLVQESRRAQVGIREGATFPTNSWQHVVLVADGAALVLYRNGSPAARVSYDGTLFNPTNALSLGARLAPEDGMAESGWWQGRMDDVAYWTRGLGPAEIFELFAAGNSGQAVTQADGYSNAPPVVTAELQPSTVYLHEPFALQVTAVGVPPLTYQWLLGGQPLADATNRVYSREIASFADAGDYSLVVSAGNGTRATSGPVALVVGAPVPNPDAGLVAYFKLDETGGSMANDASGNANHGTLLNFADPDTNWVAGILGRALLFKQGSPAAHAVSASDHPSLNFGAGPFSLAVWAKGPPNQVQGGGILCKGLGGGGEAFCLDVYSGFRFFARNSTGEVGTMLQPPASPSGRWQHLAVIYDPLRGQSGFYIDGTLAAIAPTSDSLWPSTDPLDFGARQFEGGYTLPWTGALDDVRVYGRAITPLEVRALTYQGLPPSLAASYETGQLTLTWPLEAIGYELESAPDVGTLGWTAVPGVTTNQFKVSPSGGAAFYRLHRK